jgi:hypothetical protein
VREWVLDCELWLTGQDPKGSNRALSKSAAAHAIGMDSRFRGNDKALTGRRHPREKPALAKAGAGVHVPQMLPFDFDGAYIAAATPLTEIPYRAIVCSRLRDGI